MFVVIGLATVPFDYEGNLRPGQTLAVRDINGTVRVRNSGERLRIRATKHAEHGNPAEVAIRVEQRPDGMIVCVRYPPDAARSCEEHASSHVAPDNDTVVDFDVTLPGGARLDAQSVNGSIDAATDGVVAATTVNGRVAVDAAEVTTAKTVNGSIRLRLRGPGNASLVAKTVNGSIDVQLPPGSGVTLEAKTLIGGIVAGGLTVERAPFGPGASAHGTLGDGARTVDLQTVNGSITLRR
jgi:hypothetical protein